MKNEIIHTCPGCGQTVHYGTSFSGRTIECDKCQTTFTLPKHAGYEAMRAIPWCIRPYGTHKGMVCARLQHYGEDPVRTECYIDGGDRQARKIHKKMVWPDITIWVDSEKLHDLEQSAKGKRKAFSVIPPVVDPPDMTNLIFATATGTVV